MLKSVFHLTNPLVFFRFSLLQKAWIQPEEFSASYKVIVQQKLPRDSGTRTHDDEGDWPEWCDDHSDYVIKARSAMERDRELVLPSNFSAVGCILLDFINSLAHKLYPQVRKTLVVEGPSRIAGSAPRF